MGASESSRAVFIQAVKDNLNGTPNANHPVQFAVVAPGFVGCTLCGSLVFDDDEWLDLHRKNHDKHNQIHAQIEDEAGRYKSPPTYR